NTYSPYLEIGDEAFPNSTNDHALSGQSYQEVLTNFPLGSQALTGLFVDISLSGPNGPTESYERALVDRIGIAARQGLESPHVSISPSEPPALTDYDLFTLNVLPGLHSPVPPIQLQERIAQEQQRLTELQNGDGSVSSEIGPL